MRKSSGIGTPGSVASDPTSNAAATKVGMFNPLASPSSTSDSTKERESLPVLGSVLALGTEVAFAFHRGLRAVFFPVLGKFFIETSTYHESWPTPLSK